MSGRQPPGRRNDYRWFHAITTRWMDNDVFQHVNNVNYFSYFDTAITYYEMSEQVVGLLDGPVHCVVAEVMCRYHSSPSFTGASASSTTPPLWIQQLTGTALRRLLRARSVRIKSQS